MAYTGKKSLWWYIARFIHAGASGHSPGKAQECAECQHIYEVMQRFQAAQAA